MAEKGNSNQTAIRTVKLDDVRIGFTKPDF